MTLPSLNRLFTRLWHRTLGAVLGTPGEEPGAVRRSAQLPIESAANVSAKALDDQLLDELMSQARPTSTDALRQTARSGTGFPHLLVVGSGGQLDLGHAVILEQFGGQLTSVGAALHPEQLLCRRILYCPAGGRP